MLAPRTRPLPAATLDAAWAEAEGVEAEDGEAAIGDAWGSGCADVCMAGLVTR